MPAGARLTDIWTGVCCCHHDPDCEDMSGPIITASGNVFANNLGQARLTDTTEGWCGHPGFIITASHNAKTNNLGKARVGDLVEGCNIGIIVTGSNNYFVNTPGPESSDTTPYWAIEFEGQVVKFTEVDFGNLDDEEGDNDGLNIYPPVRGRAPTPAEVAKSEAIEVAPQNTVAQNTEDPPPEETPPTDCASVPTPPPDTFQLSPNFTLGALSTRAVISHYQVRAQAGLTVPDIVCNLQGLAVNILERLLLQYGPRFILTSGFRHGSGSSQHERGQAVDIQFPSHSNSQVYDIAVWARDNLPYDQLILEYPGNRPWIHMSFNRAGNRASSAGNKFGTCTKAGSYVWRQLLSRA